MSETVLLLFSVFLLIAGFVFIIFFTLRDVITRRAPFISTRSNILADIVSLLQLQDGSVVYDLGCGDGRVLREAVQRNPGKNIRGVGIESSVWPYILARWKSRGLSIIIRPENLYTANFQDATHLYLYLFPHVLKDIEPLILAQCKAGTRIVSCDFQFPSLKPERVVEIPHGKYQLGRKLFVYEI